jgi:hypothetical protein
MTQDNDGILDADPIQAIALAQQNMSSWDHVKRKDFSDLFEKRSEAAQLVLSMCSYKIIRVGSHRKFISQDTADELSYGIDSSWIYNKNRVVGGRTVAELEKVAEERAKEIVSNLPPLRTAVQILDKTTAKKLDRVDALKKKGKDLSDQLNEVSGSINMADMDQNMSIGEFRAMIHERDKKRRELAHQLQEIGKEGSRLETEIDAFLVKGVPGLSEALVEVIKQHKERAEGLSSTTRRVVEQIQFGDCKEAMGMLKTFETDETKGSAEIAAKFTDALRQLKLSRKQLRAKKTTKKGK